MLPGFEMVPLLTELKVSRELRELEVCSTSVGEGGKVDAVIRFGV
jgi:hypothetical protein